MIRLTRALVAATLAAVTGGAIALEGRRGRRRRRADSVGRQGRKPAHAELGAQRDDDSGDEDEPLLSPTWFTLSHFSMLIVLTAMMVVGLSLRGLRRYPPQPTWYVHGGDVARGERALASYGCGGCHVIPGVAGAEGSAGPPLAGFARRMYIGGQLANTPDNLVAWLQNPQRYAPGTAMPNLLVPPAVAADMAAYLYTNR